MKPREQGRIGHTFGHVSARSLDTEDANHLALTFFPIPKGLAGWTPTVLFCMTLVAKAADLQGASLGSAVPPAGGAAPPVTTLAGPLGT